MRQVFVRRRGTDTGGTDLVFQAGKNLNTGEQKIEKAFGSITTLEQDLLLIAAATFSADRCIPRNAREDFNRRIRLSIPVRNAVRLLPLVALVEDILHSLSHDVWRIDLRQDSGAAESNVNVEPDAGRTLLFSGGLDSLAAAVEFSASSSPLQLVSHITRNPGTTGTQKNLAQMIRRAGNNIVHHQFLVSATSTDPTPTVDFEAESSQRTRSFLFVVLAVICARRRAHEEIVMMAENGQMAIHLPLNEARAGAFSTHTAHPVVLRKMQDFLSAAMMYNFSLINPYENRTKAEVVRTVASRLPAAIPVSSSCWKTSRVSGYTHCGACVPCIIRRVAIETHVPDSTSYARNIFTEPVMSLGPGDDGRRNLMDLAMFTLKMEGLTSAELIDEFPELQMLTNATETVSMYKRAAREIRMVFSRYPQMAALLV